MAGQATDDNRRMRITCWITKARNAHTVVVQYSLLFHYNSGCTNAPWRYVIRTLPVLLKVGCDYSFQCPCTQNALALYFCVSSQYYLQQSETRGFCRTCLTAACSGFTDDWFQHGSLKGRRESGNAEPWNCHEV